MIVVLFAELGNVPPAAPDGHPCRIAAAKVLQK